MLDIEGLAECYLFKYQSLQTRWQIYKTIIQISKMKWNENGLKQKQKMTCRSFYIKSRCFTKFLRDSGTALTSTGCLSMALTKRASGTAMAQMTWTHLVEDKVPSQSCSLRTWCIYFASSLKDMIERGVKLTGCLQSSSALLLASYKDNIPEKRKRRRLKSKTLHILSRFSWLVLLTTIHAPFAHLEHIQDLPTESGLTP